VFLTPAVAQKFVLLSTVLYKYNVPSLPWEMTYMASIPLCPCSRSTICASPSESEFRTNTSAFAGSFSIRDWKLLTRKLMKKFFVKALQTQQVAG